MLKNQARIFVAVNFDISTKKLLMRARDELKKQSKQGVFTADSNFHITLAFIGETDENGVNNAKNTIDEIEFSPFAISLGNVDRFQRREGDIYYIEAAGDGLVMLANDISDRLRKRGFSIDDRPFKAHITLARQVVTHNPILSNISGSAFTVKRISLMKSERINGILRYTEIFHKEI